MVRKHKKKPAPHRKIVLERIQSLFEQAQENFSLDPKLSDRYVQLARKLTMKYKVKMPSKYKRQYCKYCYSYLMPNKTCRIRTHNGHLVYYCLKCKKFNRFTYKTGKSPTKKE